MTAITIVYTNPKTEEVYHKTYDIDLSKYQISDFYGTGSGLQFLKQLWILEPDHKGLFSYVCWPEELQ
jgi:hypothetical protein